MEVRNGPPQRAPDDGIRWLTIMGYEHLKDQPTGYVDTATGAPIPVAQFNIFCDDQVRPMFTALEKMDPNHPRYAQFLDAARAGFQAKFGPVKPLA